MIPPKPPALAVGSMTIPENCATTDELPTDLPPRKKSPPIMKIVAREY